MMWSFFAAAIFWTFVLWATFPIMLVLVGLCVMIGKEAWADLVEKWWFSLS